MVSDLSMFRRKMSGVLNKTSLFLFGVKAKTRFIILSSPRSGSNLLLNYLQSHNNVQLYSEIFNMFAISKEELNKILSSPQSYLSQFFTKRYPPQKLALGFKIFYNQATAEQMSPDIHSQFYIREVDEGMQVKINMLQDYLKSNFDKDVVEARIKDVWTYLIRDKSIKIIHLMRDNKVKQYLSLVRAWKHNRWKFTSNNNDQEWHPVNLLYRDCLGFFEMMKEQENKFNQLFNDHQKITIVYENLIRNSDSELKRIQGFLNLPIQSLTASLKKQRKQSLAQSISNFKELKEKFKGSEWEKYFDE